MYPPPTGQHLTEQQAAELDDTFLSSDPFEYFRSRIASLLLWLETAPTGDAPTAEPSGDSVRNQFNRYLQRPAVDRPFKEVDVHAQVAADALVVRAHIAEALLRLACERLDPRPLGGARSLWAELAAGPRQVTDVIKRLSTSAEQPDSSGRMFRALVPVSLLEAARGRPEFVDAANVFVAWLSHAMRLLTPAEIDLHGAHNKVKHGLAVRTRADLRMTMVTQPPNEDGSIPLSALQGDDAIDIFDQPVLQLLDRGPRTDGHKQGFEITLLSLNIAAILAEAHMMAMAHGVMFHVAATEHFAGRTDLRDQVGPPPLPGYPVGGPRPSHIDSDAIAGLRFPLTNPPGGGAPARGSIIGYRNGYVQSLDVDHAKRTTGTVVDG